jgi:putative hydrolase of the HAD superfamily
MKILIFDLDDTLIDEQKYVQSGFDYIASKISKEFSKLNIKKKLNKILNKNGRGNVFDIFFKNYNEKRIIDRFVRLYRGHQPNIVLKIEAKNILKKLKKLGFSVYLLTDGHKLAQRKKINKLQLNKYFKKIYVTHEYGHKKMKPNLFCFRLIKKREKVKWSEIVYIGDNPKKDFVKLNSVGALTVRVLTGPFKNLKVGRKFDAKYKIKSLSSLNFKKFYN